MVLQSIKYIFLIRIITFIILEDINLYYTTEMYKWISYNVIIYSMYSKPSNKVCILKYVICSI